MRRIKPIKSIVPITSAQQIATYCVIRIVNGASAIALFWLTLGLITMSFFGGKPIECLALLLLFYGTFRVSGLLMTKH